MKQMRFWIAILFAAASLHAANTISIERNVPVKIRYKSGEPIIFSFNFFVKSAGIIAKRGEEIKYNTLPKGVVLMPSKGAKGILTVINENGSNYIIKLSPGGDKSAFSFEDPVYEYNFKPTLKIKSVSTVLERDIREIVKSVSLNKRMRGYTMLTAPFSTKIRSKENGKPVMVLNRKRRYAGKKYVVDIWDGLNISGKPLYLYGPDFYTKGIAAISFDRDIVKPGDTFNLIVVMNKATLKMLAEGGSDGR